MKLGRTQKRVHPTHGGQALAASCGSCGPSHTRVRLERWGGWPRQEIWQAGLDEPSLARITTPQTGCAPLKLWKNENTHTQINCRHQQTTAHRHTPLVQHSYSSSPPKVLPSQPFIRPRTTASPHKDLIPAGASALHATCSTEYSKNLLVFRRGTFPRRAGQPAPWGPSQSGWESKHTLEKGHPRLQRPGGFFLSFYPLRLQ